MRNFAQGFAGNLDQLLKEAVTEVHEMLRPHNSKYKTNSEYEIPPKVILAYRVGPGYGTTLYRVVYNYSQDFIALENVFNALAGQGQISKTHQSQLQMAIEASQDGRGETDLFEFRACKNQNLHLTFKRLDLLARLNQIAGGNRLH